MESFCAQNIKNAILLASSVGFSKNKGTHKDGIEEVIGTQPTVTLWVAPTSGQTCHLDKDCGKLVCAKHFLKAILLVEKVAESK